MLRARIGYARVSTEDQPLDLQRDALREAGCIDIYAEHASGARATRPELAAALWACREGDVLVVWKLDRLGCSMQHLVEIVEDLQQRRVGFQVLTGVHIDTTTPHGMFALQLFAAHAQTARALIQGQVIAGLVAARARRRTGGRCPKLSPEQQHLAADIAQGGISITTIATTLGGSRHTVYKALGQAHAALDLEEAGTAD